MRSSPSTSITWGRHREPTTMLRVTSNMRRILLSSAEASLVSKYSPSELSKLDRKIGSLVRGSPSLKARCLDRQEE